MHDRAYWDRGRRVTAWKLNPVTVYGGERLMWTRWVYDGRIEAWDWETREVHSRAASVP